jgi:hypothetical protein
MGSDECSSTHNSIGPLALRSTAASEQARGVELGLSSLTLRPPSHVGIVRLAIRSGLQAIEGDVLPHGPAGDTSRQDPGSNTIGSDLP